MKQRMAVITLLIMVVGTILSGAGGARAAGPQADLSIAVQPSAGTVTAGTTMDFTVTVTNQGPSQALNVVGALSLPTSMSFVAVNPPDGCSNAAAHVSCPYSVLDMHASATFVVTVAVAPDARGAQLVTGTADSSIADPDANNDARTVSVNTEPEIDLAIQHASTTPDPAVAGGPLEYQFRVDNTGRSTASGTLLQLTLPSGRIERVLSSSAGHNCAGDAQTVTCTLGTVAPAGVENPAWLASGSVITIEVQPKSTLQPPDTLLTVASIDAEEAEANTGNNFTYQTIGVVRRSDLGVTIEGPTGQIQSSTEVTYTIGATNHGPSTDTDVVLSVTFPEATLTSATVEGTGCELANGELTCTLGGMAPAQTHTITLRARLKALATTTATLQASISATNTEPEGATWTNTASASLEVRPFVYYFPLFTR